MASRSEIIIDGSIGEGGGQILRTSIALSAVLGVPIKIINIRAKRSNPGLQRQHLISVKAVAALSSAKVEGLRLGSTALRFIPGELRGGKYRFDIGTAGSITLVLQALLPIIAFIEEPIEITITGGTDVPWSPPIDYVRFVLARLLRLFGLDLEIQLKRRGHYPRGGGEVVIKAPPHRKGLAPLELKERGDIARIEGLSHCVKLPSHVAERQAKSAREYLRKELPGVPVSIELEYYEPHRDPHWGPGSGIVLWAVTEHSVLGADSLGAKGKPAERVGLEAAKMLVEDLLTTKALDRHASDMLLVFAAIANGSSILGGARLTLHAYTNLEIIKRIIPKVGIKFIEGGELEKPFTIKIEGYPPRT
ncbi:MAG: RNA 3'-terminal phosphate cyclase [Pyrodictiaceae archaeon]